MTVSASALQAEPRILLALHRCNPPAPLISFAHMLRWRAFLLVCSCVALVGCAPPPDGQTEEERDQFYRLGSQLVKERDYKGAVDSFERSLELNPRSVKAHYELGLLYENRMNEPAIALFHYKQVLRLQPNGHPAEIVLARMKGCEQEIAKNVALVQVDPAVMAELERLKEENRRLQRDLETMRALAASAVPSYTNPAPSDLRSPESTATVTPKRPPTDSGSSRRAAATNSFVTPKPSSPGNAFSATASGPTSPARPRASRTHVVRDRETFSSIARQHGVGVAALRAANPSVRPERLRPGQSLAIPQK